MQNTYLVDKELYVVNADAEIDEKVDTPVIADGKLYVVDYQYWCSDDKNFINPSKIIAATNTTNPSLSSLDKFDWPGEVPLEIDVPYRFTKASEEVMGAYIDGYMDGHVAAPKREYSKEDVLKYRDYMMQNIRAVPQAGKEAYAFFGDTDEFLSSIRHVPAYIEFEEQKVNGKLIVKTVKY